MLERIVVAAKLEKPSKYGRYYFPGDPERSTVLPVAHQPDLTPILWLLRFEKRISITASGRQIGKSLQSLGFRLLDHHDAALLSDYLAVVQVNAKRKDAA